MEAKEKIIHIEKKKKCIIVTIAILLAIIGSLVFILYEAKNNEYEA